MAENQIKNIHDLLQGFDTAMLVTHESNQASHARPMAIARVEPDCGVWFFTGRDTAKVNEIRNDEHVLVVCQAEHTRYVSLGGTAKLVEDRSKAHDLWKESYKTWFPQGIDDPNLLLIHIHPSEAEYWDSHGLKGVRYAFEAVKAYATGRTPHIKEGEQHGRVNLK
jgi:general stress protein 26